MARSFDNQQPSKQYIQSIGAIKRRRLFWRRNPDNGHSGDQKAMTTSNFNYQTLLETLREICADFAYTV